MTAAPPLNAFCVDLEEWFHICDVETPYSDPATWDEAPRHVVPDTELLMRLLAEVDAKGTFLTVGWIAEKYPDLIRALVDAGHEIGCHSNRHLLVYEMTPQEFENDLASALGVLREVSGQPVTAYRAPGFSMKPECFWAYPIMRRHGVTVDVSIVPAVRGHGGVPEFSRDPLRLQTDEGPLTLFPVSVMELAGRTIPFSGGGYLRLFPKSLMRRGFAQNHAAGRPVMTYIHPRETNIAQPRLKLPLLRYFKYYVNLAGCEAKLRWMLHAYPFGTVEQVLATVDALREYRLEEGQIVPATKNSALAPAGG